jgi:hypothetical protein
VDQDQSQTASLAQLKNLHPPAELTRALQKCLNFQGLREALLSRSGGVRNNNQGPDLLFRTNAGFELTAGGIGANDIDRSNG